MYRGDSPKPGNPSGARVLCAALLAAVGLCCTAAALCADAGHGDPSPAVSDPAVTRAAISRKLALYNDAFRSIRFIHLEGGEDWAGELVALLTLLGVDAVPLDYQHPPDMRGTLFDVTVERLHRLLQNDVMSATMFGVTPDSVLDRPNVCVITLNPETFPANDLDATRLLIGVTDELAGRIHRARHVDHRHLLHYSLEHEVFHCLDTYYYGGAPMTHEQFGGEYNMFRRESGADAWALAMHLRTSGEVTVFARNMVYLSELWMFSDSPNRCTSESMLRLLESDPGKLAAMSLQELVELVAGVRDASVAPYRDYVRQMAVALQAVRRLGIDTGSYGGQWGECEKIEVSSEQVDAREGRYRYYIQQLTTDTPVVFERPPRPAPGR